MESPELVKCPVCGRYKHKADVVFPVNLADGPFRKNTFMCNTCNMQMVEKPAGKTRLDEVIK